jgi:2-keto-4-pentenoate hydratase/2-oxohepta-3-ene-1,7-dioic acid hydratase in catechol pathway
MKIVRFLSREGKEAYGMLKSMEERIAYRIEGDIFGEFEVTEKLEYIVRFLPPISPSMIIGLGLNYRKHAEETGVKCPEIPVMFLKGINSVIGHEDNIVLPKIAPHKVDYEAELAVVISKDAKNVEETEAMRYILGYTCANDVSARDWQIELQKKQWARGKSFDTFCPLGPCLVTADEIKNPNNLKITLCINDSVYQESNTSDMIFYIPNIISNLSQSLTLLRGTVILTGTPEGVGFVRNPPVFLKDGDIVSVFIEGIGMLKNKVVKE